MRHMNSHSSGPLSMRRGSSLRGRLNTRFRTDSRRGMMSTRMTGRRDIRPPLRRRFPTIRGRDGRIGKRSLDTSRVSRKALIKRALAAAKDIDDDHTTENEADEDEEADEDKDTTGAEGDDVKEAKDGDEDDGDKTEKEEDDDDDTEGDKTVEKGEDDKEEGDEKADESKEGEGDDDEKKESAKKSPKKSKTKIADKDDKDAEKKKKDTKITTKYNRSSSYIKLHCCQCQCKCVTFKEYQSHLFRGLHRAAMRRLAVKNRDKLMEMRQAQRAAQKEEDEKVEENSEQKSSYCPLCQLNFRQPKAVHQKSDGHKEMKRFLMPYCATCKIGFKSPMAYEAHRASLEHLKFKARVERYANKDEGDDGGAEIDLENFTTVDEVGNVDEPTDSCKDNTSTPKKGGSSENKSTGRPGTDDEDESDDVDEETVIGSEHVKKVEVQYCDLCNMYLPRRDDPEKVLRIHCKTRSHLKLYIRNREDKKLRERAERIHKKKLTDAKAKKDAKKNDTTASEADGEEKTESTAEKKEGNETKDGTTDEQMWEVVDNDLGDLLREVRAEDGEEEEDDEKTSSERYDKFKHTEKNGLDKNVHGAVDEEEVTEKKAAVKKAAATDANGADKEVKAEA